MVRARRRFAVPRARARSGFESAEESPPPRKGVPGAGRAAVADGGSAPRPRTASGGVAVPGDLPRPRSGRRRPRALARALRFLGAALLLAVAGLLAMPDRALAQSSTLVSNLGQTRDADENASISGTALAAQGFNTGSNSDGYTVTKVIVHVNDNFSFANLPAVRICPADSNDLPDHASSDCTSLTPPASLTTGQASFTHAGIVLDASTRYFVVVGASSGADFLLSTTAESDEDSGKAAGWTIVDNRLARDTSWSAAIRALQIGIEGFVGTPSTDATLSGLALENAADSSSISLSPTFAAGTTSYTVSVANAVETITVKPTKGDSGATIAWLDASDTTLADADGVKAGHQVALDVGANTIKVKVTAEDTTNTQTYTLTVTRAAAPGETVTAFVSNTGQTSGTAVIVGNTAGLQVIRAQQFTTGDNPLGYTLTEVVAALGSTGSDAEPKVSIYTDSSGAPGSSLWVLTDPGSLSADANNTFTAPPGATLDPNTRYWVVFENENTGTANSDKYSVTNCR